MTRPEYDDPRRYAELAAFDGTYRDLWHDAEFLHMLALRLALAGAREVLDVGCGAGHWGRTALAHLAPQAALTGIDAQAHFLALARDQAVAAGIGERCTYLEGRAESLPCEDARFDLVTCQTVLIHVRDAAAVIREMVRVTKPGGVVLLVEPDNRAGNLALLGGEPRVADADVLAIVELMLAYERGKRALGEGDNSVGPLLPGMLAAAGLGGVGAMNNPQCMTLYPPYDDPRMRVCIDQERAWAAEDISVLFGTERDTERMWLAGGGAAPAFAGAWAAARRWTEERMRAIDSGTHHAARGFVCYYAFGHKPPAAP